MSAPVRRVMVRYAVLPERLAEHLDLLGAVFDELAAQAPAGLTYQAFRTAGDTGFVHLASISTPDGSNPLVGVPAFRAFTRDLESRCSAAVVSTGLELVGAAPR